MEWQAARDVREWPSLAEQPALYPDARPPAERTPFALVGAQLRELRGVRELRGGLDGGVFDGGALDEWLAARGGGFAERTALLAVGSNAYPRQLFDKFAGLPCADEGIVTAPAVAAGIGVAFCPILSRKGYAPVTAALRAGHAERTWLQWLSAAQLARVRETEGPRYALVGGAALAALVTPAAGLPRPDAVYAWWFDSVLRGSRSEGGGTVWLDEGDAAAEARAMARLAATPTADREALSAPNPVPAGWNPLR